MFGGIDDSPLVKLTTSWDLKYSGDASSEILVRLKGGTFFELIFIAFLGDLRE